MMYMILLPSLVILAEQLQIGIHRNVDRLSIFKIRRNDRGVYWPDCPGIKNPIELTRVEESQYYVDVARHPGIFCDNVKVSIMLSIQLL